MYLEGKGQRSVQALPIIPQPRGVKFQVIPCFNSLIVAASSGFCLALGFYCAAHLEVADGPDNIRHDMCLYSTTQHEHVLVEHAARHSTHVGWAGFRF